VSPLLTQDTLGVKFLDLNYFYSIEVEDFLDSRYRELSTPLRKQLEDNKMARRAEVTADVIQKVMIDVLIGSFAINFLIQGAMAQILQTIRSLQMIVHLPMLRVIMPANVSMFFQILMPIVIFDIFDPVPLLELYLSFDSETANESFDGIISQMKDLGYESFNSILNLGSIFIFTVLYFVLLVIYCFFKLLDFKKTASIKAYLSSKLFYSAILSLLIESYFEFLIAGVLQ
jgi:hypothetical protein